MTESAPFQIEDTPEGPTLVVTGFWSSAAADCLANGLADGLVLNYARGFQGRSLDFLDARWAVRRLDVLDRQISDLRPIGRLGPSLRSLSVQAAPDAVLDLAELPQLRHVAGEWKVLRATLQQSPCLASLITWRYDLPDLAAVGRNAGLEAITIKQAPRLTTLSGVGGLHRLRKLNIVLARRLHEIAPVTSLARSLEEFKLEDCPAVANLDPVASLTNLRVFGCADCGSVESLAPLNALVRLEVLYLWGSTRVIDRDLLPVARLPNLRDLRMQDRQDYRPRVAELLGRLSD